MSTPAVPTCGEQPQCGEAKGGGICCKRNLQIALFIVHHAHVFSFKAHGRLAFVENAVV